MGIEIERRFLVNPDLLPELGKGKRFRQGYIYTGPISVRIRQVDGGDGFLTIKGIKHSGALARAEFEYPVPKDDMPGLFTIAPYVVDKTRYKVTVDGHVWEVDHLHAPVAVSLKPVWLAEIEASSEAEARSIVPPPWVVSEVTENSNWSNARLARDGIPFGYGKG